jgi:hypothetical protein
MAMVRCSTARLAVAAAILCSCSFAQDRDSKDTNPKRKWLECDVDWIFTRHEVGSDFSLRVSFHETPLPGLRIALARGGMWADAEEPSGFLATAVTDSFGTARFFKVPAGKYTAVEKNGLLFPDDEIEVHADADSGREIIMEWPLDPLPVRTLRGKLITQADETEVALPLQPATVELVDLRSSKILETQSTIGDGSYEFSTIEPGLYVVRVIPPAKDQKTTPASGVIAIELDPAAKESTIPGLKVVQSECGGVQLSRETKPGTWEQ